MKSSLSRGIFTGLLVAILSVALAGCSGGGGKKLDGVYHAASGGPITVTIKGDKAIVQIAGESQTLNYKVEGNKLTILNPQEGDVEFTINDDGTLTGKLGLMTKTP